MFGLDWQGIKSIWNCVNCFLCGSRVGAWSLCNSGAFLKKNNAKLQKQNFLLKWTLRIGKEITTKYKISQADKYQKLHMSKIPFLLFLATYCKVPVAKSPHLLKWSSVCANHILFTIISIFLSCFRVFQFSYSSLSFLF